MKQTVGNVVISREGSSAGGDNDHDFTTIIILILMMKIMSLLVTDNVSIHLSLYLCPMQHVLRLISVLYHGGGRGDKAFNAVI